MSEGGALISVVIADDAQEIRALLRLAVGLSPDMEVLAEAANGREAVDAVVTHQPDVILLDVSMPEMDGLQAAIEIRRLAPRTAIVVYSGFRGDDMERKAIEAGADRYLEKSGDLRSLKRAIVEVASSRASVEAELTRTTGGGSSGRERSGRAP